MCNPECSYWITITGTREVLEKAKEAMNRIETVREYMAVYNEDNAPDSGYSVQYSVKDDFGTISQWESMDEDLAAVAGRVPEADITAEEIDEERHDFHRRLIFQAGKLKDVLYGRQLAPGELDSVTVLACIQKLKEVGIDAEPILGPLAK